MKCRRAKQLVFDFLDGGIADSDRVGLEKHLSDCESCETFASQVSRSLDLLHHAPEETPSDNFNWKVRLKIAREKNKLGETIAAQRKLFRTWNLRFALSAVSTFVLILAGGYFLWSSGRLPETGTAGGAAADRYATVQANRPAEQSRPTRRVHTLPNFYRTSPDLSTFVSDRTGVDDPLNTPSGAIDERRYDNLMNESQPVILRPDSLVIIKMRTLPLRYRLQQLEKQVEQLQKYLRECEAGHQD